MALDLEEFLAAVGDAIVATDRSGAIVIWNGAAERLFGYTKSEALGQSLDIIIPERLRRRHWEGYEHTMETGVTKYGTTVLRVPAIDKDGRDLSIAFTVAMTFDAQGAADVVISIIRDETERFKMEKELRRRLREHETRQSGS